MLPRGLRPRLQRDQVRDLAMAHIANLDAIARGAADEDILWQWVGGVLTWSRVAAMLGVGHPEMQRQTVLMTRVIERFTRTQRVLFTGPDYQLAKEGLDVMDQLAELVDRTTAIVAAEWSEAHLNTMRDSAHSLAAARLPRGMQLEDTP